MKALVDTNVLLDVFLKREPFYQDSNKILQLVKDKELEGYVSIQTLRDIFFIYKRSRERDPLYPIQVLLFFFEVIDVNRDDLISVLTSDIGDLEDGLLAFSAIRNGINTIITRNEKDFLEAEMAVINPKDIGRYLGRQVDGGSITIDNVFYIGG